MPGEDTSGLGKRRTIISRAGLLPILSLPFCPPFFAPHILSFLLLSSFAVVVNSSYHMGRLSQFQIPRGGRL